VPPHWWIPLRSSDPDKRKEQVRKIVEDEGGGVLEGFWEDEESKKLYALAMDVDLTQDRQDRMGVDAHPVKLHTKPLKKI
jgi:hypothetical protein